MNICLTGTINLEGFESLADLEFSIQNNERIGIKFFHAIAAGLHPDGSITLTKIPGQR